MKTQHFVIACFFLMAATADAQVYKCKDATGRIVFSDRGCDTHQTGGVVQKQTTQSQKMQSDWDAYVANNEKIMRRQREQDRQAEKDAYYAAEHARQAAHANSVANSYDRAQRQQKAGVQSAIPSTGVSASRGMTAAQRESALAGATTQRERDELLREATTIQPGARGLTAHQRSATQRLTETDSNKPIPIDQEVFRRAATPPSQISSCDAGGCNDTAGNRMNHAGGGNFTRSDGKFCTRISPVEVQCN